MIDLNSLESLVPGDSLKKADTIDLGNYCPKPESEFKTGAEIAQFIDNREGAIHVLSESLRVAGRLVQDSFETYLNSIDFNSSSFLKSALITPKHYFFEKEYSTELSEFKDKKHFELGTYIHQCILEPTKFLRIVVEPGDSMKDKKGVIVHAQFWKDQFNAQMHDSDEEPNEFHSNLSRVDITTDLKIGEIRDLIKFYKEECKLESVTKENFLKIQASKRSYDSYGGGILKKIFKHSKREVSLYTTDDETGLPVRIRPDALQFAENIGVNAVLSVKSTRAQTLEHFFADCHKLNYDLSEAMYLDVASKVTGRDFDTCIMIMFQTVTPFSVAVIKWRPEDIAAGRYKYRHALQNVISFEELGQSMGYDCFAESGTHGIIDSKLPEWAKRKELLPVNFEL